MRKKHAKGVIHAERGVIGAETILFSFARNALGGIDLRGYFETRKKEVDFNRFFNRIY
jgi:hypothetical protein